MKLNKVQSIFFIAIITCSTFLFNACNRDGYLVSESGLHYNLITKKGGSKPKIGDIMQMHLIYKNMKDSVIYDSKIIGDSFLIELTKPTFIGGIEEGFAMLGEGDSASFLVSADSIFDKLFRQPLPTFIHKGDKLKFEVRLDKIIDKKEFIESQQKNIKESTQHNKLEIENFLAQNNIQANPVDEGFYYVSLKDGEGANPQIGDVVSVAFIGKTLAGQVFESTKSIKKDFQFVIGSNDIPNVLNVAVINMKAGGLSRIILNAERSKGMFGVEKLPKNTPVMYDIELIKIDPAKKAS
jgi:FKBP-type peptidyl-prolyl cis-trans isomerase FkpA